MISELDPVVLTHDLPANGLAAGDIGTVVHKYEPGRYEVEFLSGDGHTVALLSLAEEDVRPFTSADILRVRPLGR